MFSLLTVALAVAAWIPASAYPVRSCFSRLFFDIGCPMCGMTRSVVALKSGDVAGSIRLHAFAIPFLVAGLGTWAALGLGFLMRRDFLPELTQRRVQLSLIAAFAAFIVYWLVRLAMGVVP